MSSLLRGCIAASAIVVLGWQSAGVALRLGGAGAAERDGAAARQTTGVDPAIAGAAAEPRAPVALFGEPRAAKRAPAKPAENTDYVLRGVLQTSGIRSFALVEADGVTGVYAVGSRLPGGETVADISPQSVRLDGVGGATELAFASTEPVEPAVATEPGRADAPEAGPAPSPAAAAAPARIEERRAPMAVATLEQQIVEGDALSAIRFERARTMGGGVGLRIRWLGDTELAQAIGLKRNDVLVSINSLPVTDRDAIRKLAGSIAEQGEIVIDFERKDAAHRVIVPLSSV